MREFTLAAACEIRRNHLLPESAINSVFVLGSSPFSNSFGITSYNLSHFTPFAVIDLPQVSGASSPTFLSWGKDGLAFITPASNCCPVEVSQIVLVQSRMMQTVPGTHNSATPAPVAQTLSPASTVHGGGNFKLTINGSGFVPGSQVTWNGSERTADYVSPTQLNVYEPASDLAIPGPANVVVTNPDPGGGKSTTLTFTIN